jgi:hypothetical protein
VFWLLEDVMARLIVMMTVMKKTAVSMQDGTFHKHIAVTD